MTMTDKIEALIRLGDEDICSSYRSVADDIIAALPDCDTQQARIDKLEAALVEAAITIFATPDTAERRMNEMERQDPNPDDGLIEVGRLKPKGKP